MLRKVGLEFNKNKKISLNVKKLNWLGKFIGLMFCRREKAKALLFDFKKPVKIAIHSWFVFFDFYAIWLDENEKIIQIKKIKPWTCFVRPNKKFVKLVEIPINLKYKNVIGLI